MKTSLKMYAVLFASLLMCACASNVASNAAPNKAPMKCPLDEQMVCTGKSPTRIKGQSSDIEFCRCERVDRIR